MGILLTLFFLSLSGAYTYLLAAQSEAILFFMMKPNAWAEHQKVMCSQDRDRYVYGDLRPESKDQHQALENTCQQALSYPSTEHYAYNSRGQKIHYEYYALDSEQSVNTNKQSNRPLLLFVHGISANYTIGLKYQPIARRLGFDLALMDLSNHGKSDNDGRGAAYGCREDDDLIAVLDDLLKTNPKQKILLFGTSMGAMTIADAAPKLQTYAQNIVGVILENPQSSVREIVGIYAHKRHIPDFHTDIAVKITGWRAGEDFENCAPYKRVKALRFPTMVMISEKDFMVPVWMAKKVSDQLPKAYPNNFKQYPYGDHAAIWNGQPDIFEKDLREFWEQSLKFHQQSSL